MDHVSEPNRIHNLFQLSEYNFKYLANLLNDPINGRKHFEITLDFLRNGVSGEIDIDLIANCCERIYDGLKSQFVRNSTQWSKVLTGFKQQYNMNLLGLVTLRKLKFSMESGKFFVLTSILDSNNNFIYADVEEFKNAEKKSVYEMCFLTHLIHCQELALPESACETNYFKPAQSAFISDYILPCRHFLHSDLEQLKRSSCYNYLNINKIYSNGEKAVYLLSKFFRVLQIPIHNLGLKHTRIIVLCCINLYNYCCLSKHIYTIPDTELMSSL